MKISYEFDLESDDDVENLETFSKALDYRSALIDVEEHIRKRVKHYENYNWPKEIFEFLDELREKIGKASIYS